MDYADFDLWDFKRDGGGRWTWARHSAEGEPLAGSHRSFNSMEACVDDAKRFGYSGPLALPDAS